MMVRSLIAAAALSVAALSAQAATYSVMWSGNSGYSLSGEFSFDDSLLNTGRIDETAITALSFDVLLNGVSQGSAELSTFNPPTAAFNFNFDTTAETFFAGGFSTGLDGQSWNNGGSEVGFTSGNVSQGASVGGDFLLGSIPSNQSTLTATRIDIAAVPLPASLPLLLVGLGAFGALRMRRKA